MIRIDARGHRCPVPSLRLARALRGAPAGAAAQLLTDDPMARIDVPHLMGELGGRVVEMVETEDGLMIRVETAAAPPG